MQSDIDHKLLWRSRRGMLELDLVLQPFVKQYFTQLEDDLKLTFIQLLKEDDPDLLGWLVYNEQPKPEFQTIIQIIREKTTA